MIPDVSAISGDGLARMYAAGHFLYPMVDILGWSCEPR